MLTISPDRVRLLRRVALNVGFGLVIFVVALYFSFPYERAKEVAIRLAAEKDLDVEIGKAGPAFGLAVAFGDIRIRTRPTPGPTGQPTKPTRFTVESAKVSLSPWSLLSSTRQIAVALDAFGGRIEFEQKGAPGKKPFHTEVDAKGVKMNELPGVKEAINIPLGGTLKLELDVASDTGKYADAHGSISFSCTDCVVGDGKTPLVVPGSSFLSGGLTLPKTRIGDLGGQIAIEKGVGKLKGVESKSPDFEMTLEGDVTLHDPLPTSIVNAYLRFKFSDAFLAKAATVQAMLQMAGAQGKRPDGFYGVRLGGRLGQMNPPVMTPVSPIATTTVPRPPSPTARYPSPPQAAPPPPTPTITPPPTPPPGGGEPPPPSPPPAPAEAPPPPPPPPPPPATPPQAAATGGGGNSWRAAPGQAPNPVASDASGAAAPAPAAEAAPAPAAPPPAPEGEAAPAPAPPQ